MLAIEEAKKIMGKNFIGPAEYLRIAKRFPILIPKIIPKIPFTEQQLTKLKATHLLILGVTQFKNKKPLTLVNLRTHFGVDPQKSEPCMYNQDWYIHEAFANKISPRIAWYVLQKNILPASRGKLPVQPGSRGTHPAAVVAALAFFAQYLRYKELLWKNDFIWCSDVDSNGDRIYVGRYVDDKKKNKNGFNIHRHLTIGNNLGSITSQTYAY